MYLVSAGWIALERAVEKQAVPSHALGRGWDGGGAAPSGVTWVSGTGKASGSALLLPLSSLAPRAAAERSDPAGGVLEVGCVGRGGISRDPFQPLRLCFCEVQK